MCVFRKLRRRENTGRLVKAIVWELDNIRRKWGPDAAAEDGTAVDTIRRRTVRRRTVRRSFSI